MDTPKPTPKPATGISLHPPRPAAPQGPRVPGPAQRPAKRPPTPETVKVVHDRNARPAVTDLRRPGGFRLFVGFVVALVGGLAIAYYPEPFMNNLEIGLTKYYEAKEVGWQAALSSEPRDAAAAIAKANQFRNDYEQVVRWTPQVVGVLCLLFAGWCLKKRIGLFLAASIAIAITIGALSAAFNWGIPSLCMAAPAVGLAYLIEAGPKPVDLSIRGVLGFGFVLIAIVGLVMGIFFLPRWGESGAAIADMTSRNGPIYLWSQPIADTSVFGLSAAFVDQWKDVFMWGGVLLTASIGAVLCRDKLLKFLSACMIVTLSVLLFKSAHVHWQYFPTLGENIPPQPMWSLSNIEIWQWLALVELVLVAAVLLYKSIGVGGLTVAVALVWLCCGLHVDNYAWRLNAFRLMSPAAVKIVTSEEHRQHESAAKSAENAAGSEESAVENFNKGLIGTSPAASTRQDERRAVGNNRGTGTNPLPAQPEITEADIVGVAAPLGWFYLTFLLTGVILAAGLRMMIRNPDGRTWLMCALWIAFALMAAYLYWQWPEKGKASVEGFVAALATHPIHRVVAMALATGGAAFFGTWALRWNSRYHTWLYAAAISVLIATILSFVGLAVMIRWGKFPPLPVLSYIVLAVVQSALMWVLLLHANFVRPEPAMQHPNGQLRRPA